MDFGSTLNSMCSFMSWKACSLTRSALSFGSTTASSPFTTAQPFFFFVSRSFQPASVFPSKSVTGAPQTGAFFERRRGALLPSKWWTLPSG